MVSDVLSKNLKGQMSIACSTLLLSESMECSIAHWTRISKLLKLDDLSVTSNPYKSLLGH